MESIAMDFARDQNFIRLSQCELAQAYFDRDFPSRRGADQFVVCEIFNSRAGGGAQSRVTHDEPEKRLGVEQEPHCMCSRKSSRGASKSSAILMSPLALP